MGACDNQDDVDALALLQPSNARQVAANCGLVMCSHLLALPAEFVNCVTSCVERAVPGLSSECSACYGDLAWCSVGCLTPCNVNSCTPLCLTCPDYGLCLDELNQCAGRTSLDCPDDT